MIAYHVEKGADITVGVVEVPAQESRHYGVLTATEWNRVTKFAEKPTAPDTLPGRPDTMLASMGIYVFNTRLLEMVLAADAANESSGHDFGKNVLPEAIDANRQVFAYPFQDVKTRAQSYWRDVGTIDAYYDANLELVHVRPELNIYDEDWPIWTYQVQQPPAKFVLDEEERRGSAINSMVSGGCIISGAVVRESLLFSDVRVEERSSIFRSVILPHAEIGRDCVIQGAIVDEGGEIPDGTAIGVDRTSDARRFHVTEQGVVLVTPDMLRRLRSATR
jgi:glucose-1-phosphate adenylyltransferase